MFSTAGLDQVKIPGLILPVALSLAAIGLTTLVIIEAQSNSTALRDWRDPEHLTLAYLLPPIFVAVVFGSTAAVMTSFASALAAAYFIYPPQFSFLFYEPRHIAELGFILVLAITASKTVAVITGDKPLARRMSAFGSKRTFKDAGHRRNARSHSADCVRGPAA
jgi:K+-sensing histidine kinase KdpD